MRTSFFPSRSATMPEGMRKIVENTDVNPKRKPIVEEEKPILTK